MFDKKLLHCIGEGIDVPSDGALRIFANPDIGLDDIEKQLTKDRGKYTKRNRKKTDRYADKLPEEKKKRRRREVSSSSDNEDDG
jgi:hypothetical protein